MEFATDMRALWHPTWIKSNVRFHFESISSRMYGIYIILEQIGSKWKQEIPKLIENHHFGPDLRAKTDGSVFHDEHLNLITQFRSNLELLLPFWKFSIQNWWHLYISGWQTLKMVTNGLAPFLGLFIYISVQKVQHVVFAKGVRALRDPMWMKLNVCFHFESISSRMYGNYIILDQIGPKWKQKYSKWMKFDIWVHFSV